MTPRVVLDTNVLVAALRSRRGASFAVLSAVGTGAFEVVLTVPLVLEYEAVLLRPGLVPASADDIGAVLDYLCAVGHHQTVHYLWRPRLRDPKDDMVLEATVAAGCGAVVTHNVRDFGAAAGLGVEPVTPAAFLHRLRHP